MLTFLKADLATKLVALHYAKTLSDDFALKVLNETAAIQSKEDAEKITRFYWNMVDIAVEDQENNITIEGVTDLQLSMEKLLNIFMGYLNKIGMRDTWNRVSDEINGR